jgi:hypothetical protein
VRGGVHGFAVSVVFGAVALCAAVVFAGAFGVATGACPATGITSSDTTAKTLSEVKNR